MRKFRRKPLVVEAVQFDGTLARANALQDADPTLGVESRGNGGGVSVLILTPEGVMRADKGDWIVTGVTGERYPVKPNIFEAIYEPVED